MLVVLVALGLHFPGSSVASGPHWRSLSGQCDNLLSCDRAVHKTARAAPALVIKYQPVRTVRAGVTSATKPTVQSDSILMMKFSLTKWMVGIVKGPIVTIGSFFLLR